MAEETTLQRHGERLMEGAGLDMVLKLSEGYVEKLSEKDLEETALDEEAIFYLDKQTPKDICKNAYSQYENGFGKQSEEKQKVYFTSGFMPSGHIYWDRFTQDTPLAAVVAFPLSTLDHDDGLGKLTVGCRLTGKSCTALEEKTDTREVKLLIRKNLFSDHKMERTGKLISEGLAQNCPGYDLEKRVYDGIKGS